MRSHHLQILNTAKIGDSILIENGRPVRGPESFARDKYLLCIVDLHRSELNALPTKVLACYVLKSWTTPGPHDYQKLGERAWKDNDNSWGFDIEKFLEEGSKITIIKSSRRVTEERRAEKKRRKWTNKGLKIFRKFLPKQGWRW